MKVLKIALGSIFVLFLFLLFYHLSIQEFIGDEASPMLNIDRMWDAFSLHDMRFLGFPYLFYYSPYLSIFSGTLLHLFGPNRILLRMPNILFAIATYFLLIYIFIKEKINPWIIVLSLLSYTCSGIIINDRGGAGDAQTRFFILTTGYFTWQSLKHGIQKHMQIALLTWTFGVLTMLDTVVLLPGIAYALWKRKFFQHKKIVYLIICLIIFVACYFALWMLLPYLAFKSGYQHYLSNRGLFYYFSRVNGGSGYDVLSSLIWFTHYTSAYFTIWCLGAVISAFFIKKLRLLQIVTIPAWIFVLLLKNSSFHIVMYTALFLLEAVIVTNYVMEKFPKTKYLIIVILCVITFANGYHLFTQYSDVYQFIPHAKVVKKQSKNCLDASVIQIYKRHHTPPLNLSCNYPRIQ